MCIGNHVRKKQNTVKVSNSWLGYACHVCVVSESLLTFMYDDRQSSRKHSSLVGDF